MSKTGRRRGRAFGEALEQLRVEMTGDSTLIRSSLAVATSAVEASYADVFPSSQEQEDDVEFEKHVVPLLVSGYAERYGLPGRREVEFRLPLVNPVTGRRSRTFERAGKIDGLQRGTNHRWLLVEDKLVSKLEKTMIDRLPLDAQITEYVDALLQVEPESVVDVEYRYTRWPTIKRRTKRQPETMAEFCERFSADLSARPEHYYVAERVVFPDGHVAAFRKQRWRVGELIRDARALYEKTRDADRAFPQDSRRCHEFGGCEFIPLCTLRVGARDLYVSERDDPELSVPERGEASASST